MENRFNKISEMLAAEYVGVRKKSEQKKSGKKHFWVGPGKKIKSVEKVFARVSRGPSGIPSIPETPGNFNFEIFGFQKNAGP